MTNEDKEDEIDSEEFRSLYNKLARSATLELVLLTKSRFETKENLIPVLMKEDLKLSYGDYNREFVFDSENELASINCRFDAVGKEGRKKLLIIEADYQVIYNNMCVDNESVVETFLNRVGKYAAYPYFRALAAQYSWSGHVPIPPLPVLVE